MDAYVARQPIFDANKKIYAYELLFRDGTANYVPDIDGDVATQTLLVNSFFTIGMDTILGGKKAFINFTQNLIVRKIPLLLSKANTVVEILEDVKPERDVVEAIREIVQSGYLIALDDFEFSENLAPLIQMAHIIKFDFLITPIDEIRSYLGQIPVSGKTLLAEKVETNEEFNLAKEMGFSLFQGYFFQKPEIIKGKMLSGSQVTLLQIMAEANKSEFDIEKLESLISQDIGLSYKMLQYINSAFFARANKISSIRQGLVYLGEREIRRFISLAAMTKLAQDKPNELIRLSCIRGKFCEQVGQAAVDKVDPSELFTLGMFSLLDAIMDEPMNQLMNRLPLSQDLEDALVRNTGKLFEYLKMVKAYEKGDWQTVGKQTTTLRIKEDILPTLYLKACQWSHQIYQE